MTRHDVAVALCVLFVAGMAWVFFNISGRSARELVAVVRVDNKVVARLPVSAPGLSVKPIKVPRGEALIEYGQGKVRVLPLPPEVCPRGLCWRTGWISRSGQVIVCLPNRMTVTLEGGVPEVDTVVR
ncbi:MAG TPA: NusG domain II-containing protein [Firmicutes bacterium]|nr:NusG domain II-containing protein [Candidatus Fermentithermobacillaceae bacterium]